MRALSVVAFIIVGLGLGGFWGWYEAKRRRQRRPRWGTIRIPVTSKPGRIALLFVATAIWGAGWYWDATADGLSGGYAMSAFILPGLFCVLGIAAILLGFKPRQSDHRESAAAPPEGQTSGSTGGTAPWRNWAAAPQQEPPRPPASLSGSRDVVPDPRPLTPRPPWWPES